MVQFLAQLIYYLPKKTVTNFFTQLDSISGVNRSGQKTMKQPLLKYVYNKHLSTVRNMQNDPYFATLLYVLRKELELGQKKGSVICRMLFRDNSISRGVDYKQGKLAFLPLKYGWGFFNPASPEANVTSSIGITSQSLLLINKPMSEPKNIFTKSVCFYQKCSQRKI